MKHFFRLTALLCAAMLALSGCGQDESGGTGMGSKVWDRAPAITYGTMEYETLAAQPWDSGRCEATSFYAMAETEAGFYYIDDYYTLHYADKTALGQWMPVCKDPDCNHGRDPQCSAFMETHSILIKDGRIWFEQQTGRGLYTGTKVGHILASMAPDGTDRRLEYALEEAMFGSAGGGGNRLLTPHHWLHSTCILQPDGSSLTRFFRVTEDGVTELPAADANRQHTQIAELSRVLLYGDPYLEIDALDGDNDLTKGKAYFFDGDEIKTLDMSVVFGNSWYAGGYISGNIFRSYRLNDGYYDYNLETGEEVKLADARLQDSCSYMPLPNCIIESTLHTLSISRDGHSGHKMELFDGETWHAVALPKELEEAPADTQLSLLCVTSDSILFRMTEFVTETVNKRPVTYRDTVLYRIPIGTGQWNLEYLATIRQSGIAASVGQPVS